MSGRTPNEERVRQMALDEGGPFLYALVRAMQRIDPEAGIGYAGDADLLAYMEEGKRLLDAHTPQRPSSVERIEVAMVGDARRQAALAALEKANAARQARRAAQHAAEPVA